MPISLRHELLVPSEKGIGPLEAPKLLERSVGEAVMRLGWWACRGGQDTATVSRTDTSGG